MLSVPRGDASLSRGPLLGRRLLGYRLRERLARLFHLLLLGPHCSVAALWRKQLRVRPALDNTARLEHKDLVGVDDRGEAMGNDDGGSPGRNFAQARLNLLLGVRIERRGGLVENEDARRFQIVRAIATRCFSPPESFSPRSPTMVA